MIVVTGANGQLGQAVVRNLVSRGVPPNRIVASVRDTAKAEALAKQGVKVRPGDFSDPKALAAAFAGAKQVLIISVDKLGEPALRLHQTAVETARQSGAKRVLYTSHAGAGKDSPFAPAADHATTEALLASGGAFTALRHGFYAESALHMVGHGLQAGELRVPQDGPVGWTARDDLAEADAIILAKEGRFDGITPPLTATEAVTMADIAAMASGILGRPIKHVVVSDQEWVQSKVQAGVPAPMAEMLLGSYKASRRGDFAKTDSTLKTLLGRAPRSMRDVLAAFLKGAQAAHA